MSNEDNGNKEREFVWEVILRSTIHHFNEFKDVLNFLEKEENNISYCSIKTVYKKNCVGFVIDRTPVDKKDGKGNN